MSVSRGRLVVLALVMAAAGGAGLVSVRSVNDQLAVMEACAAVDREDWDTVLAETRGRVGSGDTGRAAIECRCLALLATDAGDECVALLERAVGDGSEANWTPGPVLAVHLIQTWREQSRSREAAALAQRAARRHPENTTLFYLELETRSGVEDESQVLRELTARVPTRGPHAVRMRASLANRYLIRGDPAGALEVLGGRPPAEAGDSAGLWYETRGMALASGGDVKAVRAHYDDWRRAGGDPLRLAAHYSLAISIAGLIDPETPTVELLSSAFARSERLADSSLAEAVAIRLILALVSDRRTGEAIDVYDRARQRFELAGLSRGELERSETHRLLANAPAEHRIGTLHFRVDAPPDGATLWVSPDIDRPVDSSFVAMAMPPSGQLEVARSLGTAPQRWVYRDANDRTLASGTVHPIPGRSIDVDIAPRQPRAIERATLSRRPGDGHRRVTLLLLDCGDWRLVEYLRARGELPALDALLRGGHRAVLDSDPPLTAAALEALVWPNRRGDASIVGLVHQLGVELAGLSSIGENPFTALAALLPEQKDLFTTLGAGPHAVANLLLAHGSVRAGKHSEITGPDGAIRRVPLRQSVRDLHADERRRFPALAESLHGTDALHVRTIAAEFDTAVEIARSGEIDLMAIRIEPLDILTHAHFAEAVREGQDDGQNLLFEVYRYIDARIAELHDAIDADDILIVMSDHGIRTAMEHSRHGIFVAHGPEIPAGRAPGRPALRGVSAVLASLLDVRTDWPDTGVASFRREQLASGETTGAISR